MKSISRNLSTYFFGSCWECQGVRSKTCVVGRCWWTRQKSSQQMNRTSNIPRTVSYMLLKEANFQRTPLCKIWKRIRFHQDMVGIVYVWVPEIVWILSCLYRWVYGNYIFLPLSVMFWWLCAWCGPFCVKAFDCELSFLAFVCCVCLHLCGRLCAWCRAVCIEACDCELCILAFVCLHLCGRLCAWCRSCTTSVLSSRLYWNPILERGGSPKIGSF